MTEHVDTKQMRQYFVMGFCKILSVFGELWVPTIFLNPLKTCLQNLLDKTTD